MVKANVYRKKEWTEDDLRKAVDQYWALEPHDRPRSISRITASCGVPRQTLDNRIKGKHKPAWKSQVSRQFLSEAEELVLMDWIQYRSEMARPLSRRTLTKKVSQMSGKAVGNRWYLRFVARHPEIRLGKPSGLDPKHAQCFNRTIIDDHFRQLKEVLDTKDVPWENVYNMDEKGCQQGGGRRMQAIKYLVPRNRRPRYKLCSANLELVTIIECVSADGESLPPGFIFPGKEFHPEWYKTAYPDVSVGISENGWTDDFLCEEWFRKVFIPQSKARNISGAPILLILDGHGSHITKVMRQLAIDNNIEIFCLPAHTTHRTQPLDVGIFGPLQLHWMRRCDEVLEKTGEEIPTVDFVNEYMAARGLAFKPNTITGAFARCGIRLFNPDIFTDANFAPSASYSTQRYVPSSYPPEFYGEEDDLEDGAIGCPLVGSDGVQSTTDEDEASPTGLLANSASTLRRRNRSELEAEICSLQGKLSRSKWHAQAAQMHATMAVLECEELTQQVNTKKRKKEVEPTVSVAGVRWMTGPVGCATMDAHDAEVEAKRQKKADVAAKKSQAEVDRQKRRGEIASGTLQVTYSGALGPKKLEELREIAWSLGLKEEEVKDDYIKAIKDYLNAQMELRDIDRWAGLFDRGQRRRAAPKINDENRAPSTSQPFQPPPSNSLAHAHYLGPFPTSVQSNLGPYQPFVPYQPPQYIYHSMPVHNNNPPH